MRLTVLSEQSFHPSAFLDYGEFGLCVECRYVYADGVVVAVEHISFHAVGVLFGAVEGASVSRQVECHVQTLLPNVYCSGPIAVYHLIVSLLSKCKNYKEQYGEKKEYYVFEHNLLIFRIYNFSFLIIYLFHRILERLDVGSRNGQEVVHAEHTYAVAVAVAGHLSHIVYVYEEGAMYVYYEIVSF